MLALIEQVRCQAPNVSERGAGVSKRRICVEKYRISALERRRFRQRVGGSTARRALKRLYQIL